MDEFRLNENQITGLVGPSGSGKSTLALLLSGVMRSPDSKTEYLGRMVDDFRRYREKIGISWQMPEPVLIGPTVKDDLLLNLKEKSQDNMNYEALLESVGLAEFGDRVVDTLSGGEKRKLSLATLLAGNPEYLILDEPAAFLDPISQNEIKKLLKKLLANLKGALIISHDLVFLSDLAERIIGLRDGEISVDVPAAEFFSSPEHSRAIDLDTDMMIDFRGKIADCGVVLRSNSLRPEIIKAGLDSWTGNQDNFS